MKKEENIENAISELFNGFEPEVDPVLWSKIKQKITKQNKTKRVEKKKIIKKVFFTAGASSVAFILLFFVFSPQETKRTKEKTKQKRVEMFFEKKKTKEAAKKETKATEEKIKIQQKKKQQAVQNETPQGRIEEQGELETKTENRKENKPEKNVEKPAEKITGGAPLVLEEKKEKEVLEDLIQEKEEEKIFVPNVFTPNNDGKNDYFKIKTTGIKEFSITILSKKNEVVFRSTDTSFVWGGTGLYQDKQPEGSYVYYIIGKNKGGDPIKKHGFLFLKR